MHNLKSLKNIGDGIWWAIITFATVGYGDIYPITFLGKLLGCIICLVGVAMVAIPTVSLVLLLSISYKRRNKERNSIRKRRIDDNKVPQKQLLGSIFFSYR